MLRAAVLLLLLVAVGAVPSGAPVTSSTAVKTASQCTDLLVDVDGDGTPESQWHDSDGPQYTCAAYETNGWCAMYSNYGPWPPADPKTAGQVCCACGGGVSPPTPSPPVCSDRKLSNGDTWHDSDGTQYTCAWYALGSRCAQYGNSYKNEWTANEACCVCGGGVTETPAPAQETPAPTQETPAPTTGEKCGGKRVRKEWRALTLDERVRVIKAFRLLKQQGKYDKYPQIHGKPETYQLAHDTGLFMPWHRVFIQKLEDDMRSLGGEFECVTLPYWDWAVDGDKGYPFDAELLTNAKHNGEYVGFGSVFNGYGSKAELDQHCFAQGNGADGCCVNEPFSTSEGWYNSLASSPDGYPDRGEWPTRTNCLYRYFPNENNFEGTGTSVTRYMTPATYGRQTADGFRYQLEIVSNAPHTEGHGRIGGFMITDYSPEDPIFFLHHCNVDRMWAMWQVCHGYDSAADSGRYEPSGKSGVNDGPNDEMLYPNPYKRQSGQDPNEWPGYTASSVWDLHAASLYTSATEPRVQYLVNSYNSHPNYATVCAGRNPLGRNGWFTN